MNRRDFLKILGLPVVVGLSPLVPKEKLPFKPNLAQKAILKSGPKGIRTLNFNPGDAFKGRPGTEFICDKGKCVQFTFTTENEGIVHCETWASNGDGRLVRLRQDDLPSLLTFNKV